MDHRGTTHVDGGDDFGDKRQFCTDYNPTPYHADNRFASIFTRCPGAKNLGSPAWSMETKTVPADTIFSCLVLPVFRSRASWGNGPSDKKGFIP